MKHLISKIKLFLIVWLLHSLDRRYIGDNALWDTAQNYMEWLAKRQRSRLWAYSHDLGILSYRATERAHEILDDDYYANHRHSPQG